MYEEFAGIYDLFMEDMPYDAWADRLIAKMQEHGIAAGSIVCELGCGTGQITRRLARAGYDMIGIDAAPQMLNVARQSQEGGDILYLCQDMRSFELYGTVGAIVCVCDSLNYLLSEEELAKVFSLAANYLDIGGIFLFDLKTADFYRRLGMGTFAENRESAAYIWENEFDEETKINAYDLTFFLQEEDGRFSRFTETHVQRAYDIKSIEHLLSGNGFRLLSVTQDYVDTEEGDGQVERLFFTAQATKTD